MLRLLPDGWIRSLRHFLLEIVTITVGIVIGLGLDGMVDRRAERKLAGEAIASMRSEMADNLRDVDRLRVRYREARKFIEENLAAIRLLQAGGKPKAFSTRLSLPSVSLTASSLSTAEATGALRHMDYAEARRYADAFGMQQEFLRQQARLMDRWVATTPTEDENLHSLSPPELAARGAELTLSLREMAALESWAKTLADCYQGRLKDANRSRR
jgi:hypothetical protein